MMWTLVVALCSANGTATAHGSHDTAREGLDQEAREVVQRWRERHGDDGPGGGVAVIIGGEVRWLECFGHADLEFGRAFTADTPIYVGSVAKVFTAACAVHAAEHEGWNLDTRVSEWLPSLPPTYDTVTVQHLLWHRSGIVDVYDAAIALDLGSAPVRSNETALEFLSRSPTLAFLPGSRFLYSNSGYVLLAELIEQATGRGLAEYATEAIFAPLGMDETWFLNSDRTDPTAKSYTASADGWSALEIRTGMIGPGGMITSLADLAAFEAAVSSATWESDEFRDRLLEPPESGGHPRIGQYAAGWMLQRFSGQDVVRHFGGAFGFSADILRFPEEDLSFVAVCNDATRDATDLTEEVAATYLGELFVGEPRQEPRSATPRADPAALRGAWIDEETGIVVLGVPGTSGTRLLGLGDFRLDVEADGANFRSFGSQVEFTAELEENTLRLIESRTGRPAMTFRRLEPPTEVPMSEFVGDYASVDHEGAVVQLREEGNALRLVQHDPLIELPPFRPLAPDRFLCDRGATLHFLRNENGDIVAARLDANRAWNLQLNRLRAGER